MKSRIAFLPFYLLRVIRSGGWGIFRCNQCDFITQGSIHDEYKVSLVTRTRPIRSDALRTLWTFGGTLLGNPLIVVLEL